MYLEAHRTSSLLIIGFITLLIILLNGLIGGFPNYNPIRDKDARRGPLPVLDNVNSQVRAAGYRHPKLPKALNS